MNLKQVRLHNIRSYIDTIINFEDGITLLAGDIGSGKSTILLAVEFALFGLQRTDLSGSMLLRNGEENGFVELKFVVNTKEYLIKRLLRRSNDSVVQDGGFFVSDSGLQKLTSGELKTKILEILNYPKEMLTKRSLIYRYTVYAPQEDMKLILQGDKEDRIDTLRKVFNIDKYKRIAENSKFLFSDLRSKKKELNDQITTLEKGVINKSELQNKRSILNSKLKSLEEDLSSKLTELNHLENKVLEFEGKRKEIETIKHEAVMIQAELNSCANLEKIHNKNLINLINMLDSFVDLPEFDLVLHKSKIKEYETNLAQLDQTLEVLNAQISEFSFRKNNSNEIKKKLSEFKKCPTCYQIVSESHKEMITSTENKAIAEYELYLQTLMLKKEDLLLTIKNYKRDLEELKVKLKDFEIFRIRKEEYEKNLKSKSTLEIEINQIKVKKVDLEKKLNQLKLKINDSLENETVKLKDQLKLINSHIKDLEVMKATLIKDQTYINDQLLQIETALTEIELLKTKLMRYNNIFDWMQSKFIELVNNIEKNVLARIYSVFDSYFRNWFELLMGGEVMKVKLDRDFTPRIEQNGYDLDYLSLSGGEKTACALAYRLALNQVIHDISGFVNTSDLIILDEPTDGFSSQQLDKMREVLEQLKINQIVIVSHEEKMESFSDRVVRLEKRDGVTSIA